MNIIDQPLIVYIGCASAALILTGASCIAGTVGLYMMYRLST